jgi:hypothetical protein
MNHRKAGLGSLSYFGIFLSILDPRIPTTGIQFKELNSRTVDIALASESIHHSSRKSITLS